MSQIYISYDVRVGIMILLQCFSQSRFGVLLCALNIVIVVGGSFVRLRSLSFFLLALAFHILLNY